MPEARTEALLSVRAVVVLAVATVAGIVAGALSYLSSQDVPAALLIGAGAAGGAAALLHNVLGQ